MLPSRDQQTEKRILTALSIKNLNYAVLQPDWEDAGHGDIDIVLDYNDWQLFISTIHRFIADNEFHLVKAYEIEYGVICIVILTMNGTVFLDVALTSHCKKVFGLPLDGVLNSKDTTQPIPFICSADHDKYRASKQSFKRSFFKKTIKKVTNLSVIIRRVLECTIIIRGAIIYIPYIIDTAILKSNPVMSHVSAYFSDTLLKKYK